MVGQIEAQKAFKVGLLIYEAAVFFHCLIYITIWNIKGMNGISYIFFSKIWSHVIIRIKYFPRIIVNVIYVHPCRYLVANDNWKKKVNMFFKIIWFTYISAWFQEEVRRDCSESFIFFGSLVHPALQSLESIFSAWGWHHRADSKSHDLQSSCKSRDRNSSSL